MLRMKKSKDKQLSAYKRRLSKWPNDCQVDPLVRGNPLLATGRIKTIKEVNDYLDKIIGRTGSGNVR